MIIWLFVTLHRMQFISTVDRSGLLRPEYVWIGVDMLAREDFTRITAANIAEDYDSTVSRSSFARTLLPGMIFVKALPILSERGRHLWSDMLDSGADGWLDLQGIADLREDYDVGAEFATTYDAVWAAAAAFARHNQDRRIKTYAGANNSPDAVNKSDVPYGCSPFNLTPFSVDVHEDKESSVVEDEGGWIPYIGPIAASLSGALQSRLPISSEIDVDSAAGNDLENGAKSVDYEVRIFAISDAGYPTVRAPDFSLRESLYKLLLDSINPD